VESLSPQDRRLLRNALGCFATGVTIITACGPEGYLGFTANSFNSVSLDPPLVLFSLGRHATSLPGFQFATHFAINVLREDQMELSNRFARPNTDKWMGVDFITWKSGCPILKGTLASFECERHATYDGGDHVIFVGEVIHMHADLEGRPLLYFRGGYTGLGG
jgi:flavin reductase (DIM6/NTAB) family NADH-FMN oxidoreductase RutF